MAFIAKNIATNNKKEEPSNAPLSTFSADANLNLTKSEVETLLLMIKEAHFKGEHVQRVYELVLKLQTYYTKLP